MKPTTDPAKTRQEARSMAAYRCQRVMIQLLCAVSMLRTILTRIVPLAGSGAWWTALLCMLPGAAVYGVFLWGMRLTRVQTLMDLVRACLGRLGGWLLCLVLPLLLLLDGTASMTALITMFTEGLGTRGTQLTMALLTSGVLLTCLHREGLPRGVYLLRWVMIAAGVLMAAFSVQDVHADSLFPLLGSGTSSLRTALTAGVSLAWPLVLLLTVPSPQPCRRVGVALMVLLPVLAVVLLLVLTVPHELLIRHHELAGSLLLPTTYALPAIRTLSQCLLMLVLFLAIGAAAQLATDQLCAPVASPPRWLPYVVLILLAATQVLDIRRLWSFLEQTGPLLLLPLAVLAAVCIPVATLRRWKA